MKQKGKRVSRIFAVILTFAMMMTLLPFEAIVTALPETNAYNIFVQDGFDAVLSGANVKITAEVQPQTEDPDAEPVYLKDSDETPINNYSLGLTNDAGMVSCSAIYDYFASFSEGDIIVPLDITLSCSLDGYSQKSEDTEYTITSASSDTKVLYKIVPVASCTAYSGVYDEKPHDVISEITYADDYESDGSETVSYKYKFVSEPEEEQEEQTADSLEQITNVADASKYEYVKVVVNRDNYAEYVSDKLTPEITPADVDVTSYKVSPLDRAYSLSDGDKVKAITSVTDSTGVDVDASKITYCVTDAEGSETTYTDCPEFSVTDLSETQTELTMNIKVVISNDENHTDNSYNETAKLRLGTLPDFTFDYYGEYDEDTKKNVATFDGNEHSLISGITTSDETSTDNYTINYKLNDESVDSVNNLVGTDTAVYNISATVSKQGFVSKSYNGCVVIKAKDVDGLSIEPMELEYLENEDFSPSEQNLFTDELFTKSEDDTKNYELAFSQTMTEDEKNAVTDSSALTYSSDVPKSSTPDTYYYFVRITVMNGNSADTNYNEKYILTSAIINNGTMNYDDVLVNGEVCYTGSAHSISDLTDVVRDDVLDNDGNVICKDEYTFKLVNVNGVVVEGSGEETTIPKVTDVGTRTYHFTLDRTNYTTYEKDITFTVKAVNANVEKDDEDINVTMNKNNRFNANITNIVNKISIDNGNYEYFNKATDVNHLDLLGAVTYEITKTNSNATISNTGVITYYGVDTIDVTAKIAATSSINEITINYTVSVKYNTTNMKAVLSGTAGDKVDDTQWYRSTVGITPEVDGWNFRECNSTYSDILTRTSSFVSKISKTSDNTYELYLVFANRITGEVAAPVKVSKFAIDTKKATLANKNAFVLSSDTGLAQTSFGCFSTNTIAVKVNATDTASGIKTITLQSKATGTTSFKSINSTTKGGNEFHLDKGTKSAYSGVIGAKITDYAGNVSDVLLATTSNSNIKNSNLLVMIEENAPTADDVEYVSPNGLTRFDSSSGNTIYSGDISFAFTANDSKSGVASNSGIAKVIVKINGKEVVNNDYSSKKITSKSITAHCSGVQAKSSGAYECVITVIDNAGNQTDSKKYVVYKDTQGPSITEFSFDGNGNADSNGTQISNVQATDYGFYFKDDVRVYVTAEDEPATNEYASGVKSITFKAVDINGDTVVEGTNNTDGTTSFVIPKNFKGQIYAYAIDNLDNTPYDSTSGSGFVHPDGSIIENADKHYDTSSISISAPTASGTENSTLSYGISGFEDKSMDYNTSQKVPLYNSNPTFGVTVSDSYSGIRRVKWTYIEGNTTVSSSTVTVDNSGNISGDGWDVLSNENNLVTSVGTNVLINGNSNDCVLLVELEDRAGNVSFDYYCFGIDKTKPVISVTYDNNTADSQNKAYYNKKRKATVVITERNFDSDKVLATITNADGTVPKISGWTSSGSGDQTKYTATIDYTSDGAYSFAMGFTDNAGNKADDVTKQEFTVDTTLPVVTVEYDNNSALNDKYFKAVRNATVTVKEHNFDVARASISVSASLNGKSVSSPKITWKDDGDTHVATVKYTADADYTFSATVSDMASNKSLDADFGKTKAGKDFVIDTKINAPEITGVENETAYKGDVIPVSTYTDINFDEYSFTLTRTKMDEKDKDVSEDYKNEIKNTANGGTQTFENFEAVSENDGIYTLTASITDKAGNKSEDTAVIFSVNRFGSVFVYSDYINTLIDEQYVREVTQSLVITEYNPDKLVDDGTHTVSVTCDGAGVSGEVATSPEINDSANVGESGWYQYNYSVPTGMFSKDGVYSVAVTSKDEAENVSDSSVSNGKISFSIDTVKPEITSITGLEERTYNAESIDVGFDVFDAMGLKSVVVSVNGKEVKTIDEMTDLNECKDSFTLGDGADQLVEIKVEDLAGNTFSTSDNDFRPSFTFENTVTVSTNLFILWFSNKILFFGSILGGGAVIALIIVMIVRRKKRVR